MVTEEFQNSRSIRSLCSCAWLGALGFKPYGPLHAVQKGHRLCVVPDRKKKFIPFCPERGAELTCRMELFIGTMRQKQVGVS